MESRLNIKHDVPFSLEEDQILYLDPIGGEHLSELGKVLSQAKTIYDDAEHHH